MKKTKIKDEVKEVKIVEVDNYISRKGKTYEFIGSDPKDWQPAEIKGYLKDSRGQDVPTYHLGSVKKTESTIKVSTDEGKTWHDSPAINTEYINDEDDYTQVETPYSEGSEPYMKLLETQRAFSNTNTMIPTSLCNLCGHGIIELHYTINYKTKQYMQVGSRCIHHHYGAVVRKKIKIFKDNEIRQDFLRLREVTVPIYERQKNDLQEWERRAGRIEYWAWKTRKTIEAIVTEKTGSRKLQNRNEMMIAQIKKSGTEEEKEILKSLSYKGYKLEEQ